MSSPKRRKSRFGLSKPIPQITGRVKKATPYMCIYSWIVQVTTVETAVKWMLEEVSERAELYSEHSDKSDYPGDITVYLFSSFT